MNLNDLLQLNQISISIFLVALVGLWRERTLLPFLAIIIGSFFKGEVFAILTTALIIWARLQGPSTEVFRVKDAISLFLLMMGTALPAPYHEFLVVLGVMGISYTAGEDRLGATAALMFSRIYFEQPALIEVVLGAAAATIIFKEVLIITKTPLQAKLRLWLDPLFLLGILVPFKDFLGVIIENEMLMVIGSCLCFGIFSTALWTHLKKPRFQEVLSRLRKTTGKALSAAGAGAAFERPWVVDDEAEPVEDISEYFKPFFWWTALILILWMVVVLVGKGGALEL